MVCQLRKYLFFLLSFSSVSFIVRGECIDRFKDDGVYNRITPFKPISGKTLTSFLGTDVKAISAISTLEDHFDSLREELQAHNKTKPGETNTLGINPVMSDRSRYFGFGKPEDFGSEIDYDLFEVENKSFFDTSKITSAIENLAVSITSFGSQALTSYNLSWVKGISNDVFYWNDKSDNIRNCTAFRSVAVRLNGSWAVGAKLYELPYYVNALPRQKKILTEFVLHNQGKLSTLDFNISNCNSSDQANGSTQGTAVIEYWGGKESWVYYFNKELNEHLALKSVIDSSTVAKELVQDSGAASNIAILMLPALLSLVPLGLFQDFGLVAGILYAIATDVISVLPILIKGFELLITGNSTFYSMISKIYGVFEEDELGWAQTWTAKCTIQPHIRIKGIVFVTIGFSSMFIGIFLELLTIHLTRKARNEYKKIKRENSKLDRETETPPSTAGLYWFWKTNKGSEKQSQ